MISSVPPENTCAAHMSRVGENLVSTVEVSSVKCDDESAAAADQTFSVTTSQNEELDTDDIMVIDTDDNPQVRAAFCERKEGGGHLRRSSQGPYQDMAVWIQSVV